MFKEWLFKEIEATSGKTGLYPLGYGGIGLYPVQYYMPIAADSILYVSIDDRLYKNGDGPPWPIKHIKTAPSWPPTLNPNTGPYKPFKLLPNKP